ncbi:GtrA family protein [Rapidithrix thailandica]|uniref:GtrA family protein n=1 Tax=Rapidithrix thailandica TaxID=413964 RepID=A0AAW9RUW7_9BACT
MSLAVYELILKFIKFGVVGGSGVGIDFGLTYLLKEKASFQKYMANSLGFIVAASSNYYFNRVWTFENHNPEIALQFSKFILISCIGLLLNNLFIFLLNNKFKLHFYLAKLFAIGIVTMWNFAANYIYTFS